MRRLFCVFLLLFLPAVAFAQSTDPDNPTKLTSGTIEGTNSGSLNDTKTTYYKFNVKKGQLRLVLDVIPLNKSDAGGLLEWTLLDTKFNQLKYDNRPAHAVPERQIKEMQITIPRTIILKVVAGGNMDYKLVFSGSATNLKP